MKKPSWNAKHAWKWVWYIARWVWFVIVPIVVIVIFWRWAAAGMPQ